MVYPLKVNSLTLKTHGESTLKRGKYLYNQIMHTDQAIYQYLATGAEAFQVLTGGMTLQGAYEFTPLVLKSLERRLDALFVPVGHTGTAYIIEFQAQRSDKACANLMTKIGLYAEDNVKQVVHGIIIFPRHSDGVHDTFWVCQGGIKAGIITVVYLEDFLPQLLVTQPNNPYVAVFAPLILADTAQLEHLAPKLWHTVHTAPIPEATREVLQQVLQSWYFERFTDKTAEEVLAMLQILTPLHETRAYKGIFAEGKYAGRIEGKAEGKAEGEATLLKRLIIHRFSKLPKWAEKRLDQADTTQLETWAERILTAKTLQQLFE